MDRNPALEMHPVEFTDDPFPAARNDKLVAINATLQIDLLGQCDSESLGHAPFSGTGGQSDFVRAANRSRGGKAIIVLPSTALGGSVSRIVPTLAAGTHVSTSKNDIDYVVTQYGVAQLRDKSAGQRAAAFIDIAHPDFRGELAAQARTPGRAWTGDPGARPGSTEGADPPCFARYPSSRGSIVSSSSHSSCVSQRSVQSGSKNSQRLVSSSPGRPPYSVQRTQVL